MTKPNLTQLEQHAHRTLTDKQFAAFILWNRGAGIRRIADLLDVSVSTARDRLDRALRNLGDQLKEDRT